MATTEEPHVLIVNEYNRNEPADSFDLEHHEDCPTVLHVGLLSYTEYACHVGMVVSEVGLGEYFMHRDDPRPDDRERLAPGRHLIAAWTECTPATYWHGAEWDYGIRLVEATEAVA